METRPWALAGPPLALVAIGTTLFVNALAREPIVTPTTERHVAYALWATALLWIVVISIAWAIGKLREKTSPVVLPQSLPVPPTPVVPVAECGVDGEIWPKWFTLHIPETGETFCLAHLDGKPYPVPGETEDQYVARWIRDGKPVRNP
jgi:hypothetical protein